MESYAVIWKKKISITLLLEVSNIQTEEHEYIFINNEIML